MSSRLRVWYTPLLYTPVWTCHLFFFLYFLGTLNRRRDVSALQCRINEVNRLHAIYHVLRGYSVEVFSRSW